MVLELVHDQAGQTAQRQQDKSDPGEDERHSTPRSAYLRHAQGERNQNAERAAAYDKPVERDAPRGRHEQVVHGPPAGKAEGPSKRPPQMRSAEQDAPSAGGIGDPMTRIRHRALGYLIVSLQADD